LSSIVFLLIAFLGFPSVRHAHIVFETDRDLQKALLKRQISLSITQKELRATEQHGMKSELGRARIRISHLTPRVSVSFRRIQNGFGNIVMNDRRLRYCKHK
jgi:hypothetical protein